ncbi:MAG: transcriptional regulator [Deltaproteobacteria bacterium]|nr:MAG: transcriptional regulator [Deltaproteobacteria bacterium]
MTTPFPPPSQASVDAFLQRTFLATGIETQTALATFLGVNRAAISMAKKKGQVPEKWALKLAELHGLNPRWLLEGRGERYLRAMASEDAVIIPKVAARLCAGGGSFETASQVQDTMTLSRSWLTARGNPNNMVLMDILGDSMEPEIWDGDTVLIDQSQTRIHAGFIYALSIQDSLLIKRVERHPQQVALISANPNYTPIFLQGDELATLRVLGRVLWACRDYGPSPW